ncbi:MAG: type II secretion system F family protein [Oxalicibacterium faecigallinarum]|uniref:type II secretion system F family protein n=1 Tax=Oxalicibacterium faecigallinarum TaxID=573741 RepID=UPI00280914ED|nr:type II secretion system F family protein [Oxalicibacterium faecigallinarum]MDQ7968678.1 type II secretion system F family protein [Oxalicibacterium faecigallinarum]
MTTHHLLLIAALAILACAIGLIGMMLMRRTLAMTKSERMLNQRLDATLHAAQSQPEQPPPERWMDRLVAHASHWVDTPLGRQLVAQEDRHLLDQCGVNDVRGKTLFFLSRVLLGVGFPILAWMMTTDHSVSRVLMIIFFGFGAGYMLPKWIMLRVAKERRRKAAEELPLLIDLLRLLQGIGMSMDQSLHIIESELSAALPILGKEIRLANRQYANGRTREQSLRRLATVFDNDDLHAITRLIVQVDQYGGMVQQPLQQFSDQIREQRKFDMKEQVGKLTVKMTSVMVVTLLPALLIITGGSGFLAVIRTLSSIGN